MSLAIRQISVHLRDVLRSASLVLFLAGISLAGGCLPTVANEELNAGAPTTANVQDGGTLYSGFLVGKGGTGSPSLIEVSFDGAPFIAAAGTATWTVPIPIPSSGAIWRDGSQHTVRIRSNAGREHSITIRKGINRDVNGDGYPDFAVGTADYTAWNETYVLYSAGPAGIPGQDLAAVPASTILSNPGTFFGYSVALGDVDGDGYGDLVVGGYAVGQAYIFLSSGPGGIPSTACSTAACPEAYATLSNSAGIGNFGALVGMGDIDGDGYADVVVGGNTGSFGFGIFYSGPSGIATGNQDAALTGVGGNFGINVALGDINGDGYADLVGGASGAATVNVYNSGPGGIGDGAPADATLTGAGGTFGVSVALGDVNNDGYADLAVGNPGAQIAYVFQSQGSSGIGSVTCSNALCVEATSVIIGPANFGLAVAVDDVNGDGHMDLAVGGADTVHLINSSGTGGIPEVNVQATPSLASAIAFGPPSISFGAPIALWDAGADGHADLVVAATAFNSNQGAIYIYPATSAAGFDVTPESSLTGPAGSGFAFSITH